jgi:hypothetical protein
MANMTMANTATIAMIIAVFSVIVLWFWRDGLTFLKAISKPISAVINPIIAVDKSMIVFIPIYYVLVGFIKSQIIPMSFIAGQ